MFSLSLITYLIPLQQQQQQQQQQPGWLTFDIYLQQHYKQDMGEISNGLVLCQMIAKLGNQVVRKKKCKSLKFQSGWWVRLKAKVTWAPRVYLKWPFVPTQPYKMSSINDGKILGGRGQGLCDDSTSNKTSNK